jgi:prevent-host-death family protein
MRSVSVAEAKAKLSEIIQAVVAGEDIRITRHGQPVVRLVAEHPRSRKPIDVEALRRWQAETPMSPVAAVDLIRADRDGA